MTGRARVARAVSPPEQVAEVKAIACELPATHGLPLGRFSRSELHRLVIERAVCEASASTIWRWLSEDAIKPWQQRSWLFVRDPDFAPKASRVLDLYQRCFEGRRLRPDELMICADEKSQLQALGRRHQSTPAGPGRTGRVEFDYRRGGTLAYLAAWDVHHARLFGRIETKTGIEPFSRLVEQVMISEPYASARRVFWIVDNGSSHAGKTSIQRLEGAYENLRLIHLPSCTSRSFSARRSHPTTSTTSKISPSGSWPSKTTARRSPDRSPGTGDEMAGPRPKGSALAGIKQAADPISQFLE